MNAANQFSADPTWWHHSRAWFSARAVKGRKANSFGSNPLVI